ncbi:hypothetical protein GOP47_0018289 [Adiantum capillus-veneris]|uniref:F-box domain-containing protein n=1 Tax=Adiantum capillus-veneris TaxID=13818 RepID=A0A9D4UH11_ADICA|nr:hypothetical protein GOP47_0018289 [Adiantum capillus-veneris]
MKLRIRAASVGASSTFKVEVPAACSLQGLEDAIAEALQSRGIPVPHPLRISLNKRESIQGHSTSLLSQFGICNGDLLFYFESSDASSETTVGLNPDTASMRRELCAAAAARRASALTHPQTEGEGVNGGSLTSVVNDPHSSSNVADTCTDMQIDGENLPQDTHVDAVDAEQERLSNSIPAILQRILNAENGSVSRPSDFLLLAVHAVMLETGFTVMNAVEEGHTLPGGWSNGGVANICYMLRNMPDAVNAVGSVVLKSLTLGGNVVIYGTITGSGLSPRKISLLTSKHIIGNTISHDDPISSFSDLFELWKCAKDELSLPLLTALCEMTGLPPPSSFLVIPTELKMKILDRLTAMDLVKVGSTCSELRHLSANDELWKKLFYEDFGNPSAAQQLVSFRGWKSAYAVRFLDKKRMLERRPHIHRPFYGIGSRSRFPRIIGGDYDIYPPFGGGPFRSGLGGAHGPLGGIQGRFRGIHGRLRDDDLGNRW